MRSTRRTLTLIGILAPLGAHALGVGELRLQSSLNQTLKAEAPLVISGEKPEDVKVMLATPEAFTQAGVERHHFLTTLRFSPVRRQDGSYAIDISSREPIREPFLNFLIEVTWQEGRIVKEFTVLVDPPATVLPGLTPSRQPAQRPRYTGPAAGDSGEPMAYAQRTGVPPGSASEYGPVRRRDTLSSIAQSINGEGDLTTEQIMVGLYRANPGAFIGGNVNALKHGAVLTIPSHEALAGRTPAEATREFHDLPASTRQSPRSDDAEARRERIPESAMQAPVETGAGADAPGSRLRLLAPEHRGRPGSSNKPGGREEIALEVAESIRLENEEIRARLGTLEQQISALQKLLELKDQQIVALQAAPAHSQPEGQPLVDTGSAQSTPPPVSTPEASPAGSTPSAPVVHEPVQAPPAVISIQPPVVATVPEQDDAFWGSPWLWSAGLGVLALAALLAWKANQRRRQFALGLGLSTSLRAAGAGKRESVTATRIPTPERGSPGARSLEAYSSSAQAVDSGEPIDPIAEADAFLANGRQAQAEQLMRAAVASHPERDEFQFKLLEILSAGEKYDAFETLAEQLSGWKDSRPELWAAVSRMSLKLRLKPAVKPGAGSASIFDPPTQLPLRTEEQDIQEAPPVAAPRFLLELPEPGSDQAGTEEETNLPEEIHSAADAVEPESASVEIGPIEFDLSGLDFNTGGNRAGTVPESAYDEENLIAYEPTSREEIPQTDTGDDSLEDILAALESLEKQSGNDASGLPAVRFDALNTVPVELIEISDIPAELATSAPSRSNTKNAARADADLYAEITDMDPLETKLDLGKAYVDMGDVEAARELLEAVLGSGNDRQKAEALTLLERVKTLQ